MKERVIKGPLIALVGILFAALLGVFLFLLPDKKGTISGVVADEATDLPVFGVTVTATDSEGERFSSRDNIDTTGQDGYFKLELPVGVYTLEFDGESQGYELFESSKEYSVKNGKDTEIDGVVHIRKKAAESDQPGEESGQQTEQQTEQQPEQQPGQQTEQQTEQQPGQQTEQQKDQQQGQQTEQQPGQQTEQQPGQQPAGKSGKENSGAVNTTDGSEKEKELFTIDPDQIEDYGANMDPYEYYKYYSDYKEFSFGYPPHLFNRVESSYDNTKSYIGKNIESHSFYGSRGSVLTFSLAEREDNLNLTKKINKLLDEAGKEITDSKHEIQKEAFEDKGFARGVVSGFNSKGFVIYTLIKANPSYVMQMRMVCPPFTSQDDRLVKRYVQECIYRWCGFANKDKGLPRSFKEFREEEENKKK